MMNKKGVEISMNVLIVAAIGLLVLVVLSIMFLGRIGTVGEKLNDCAVQSGKCGVACGSADYGTQEYPNVNPTLSCPKTAAEENQVCCIPVKV